MNDLTVVVAYWLSILNTQKRRVTEGRMVANVQGQAGLAQVVQISNKEKYWWRTTWRRILGGEAKTEQN